MEELRTRTWQQQNERTYVLNAEEKRLSNVENLFSNEQHPFKEAANYNL